MWVIGMEPGSSQEQLMFLTAKTSPQSLEVLNFSGSQFISPSFPGSVSAVLSRSANRLFCSTYLEGFCEFAV